MAYQIAETCDNCFNCLEVCDTNAIMRPGEGYSTDEEDVEPLTYDVPYIIQDRCNGCGEGAAAKCVEVCTLDAIHVSVN